MNICAKPAIAIALCGGLVACGGLDPTVNDNIDYYKWDIDTVREMAPQGSTFSQGLRSGYLDIAESEYEATDYTSADHFYRKAVASAKGLNVQPDQTVLYKGLAADKANTLNAARARLTSAIDDGGRAKVGAVLARAQTSHDCWLENESEGDQAGIDRCKAAFEEAMAEAERALATTLDNRYIVFFAWDQWDVSPVAQEVLNQVVEDFGIGSPIEILVAGFADTSGTAAYNIDLSERRARSIAAALVGMGIPEDAIGLEWFGETMLRVETPDGVREPQNRRVEIRFVEAE